MRNWAFGGGVLLLGLLLVLIVPQEAALSASEPGAVGTHGLEPSVDEQAIQVADALTVTTRFTFPAEAEQRGVDTFWLAGFSVTESGTPDLVLRWRKDGWFQLWTLGLDSRLDVLPASLRPSRGAGLWSQYQVVTLEGSKFPDAGHIYETTVSYAPGTGYLAVSVFDETAGQQFWRGVIQLDPVDIPLYPVAGLHMRSGSEQEVEFAPRIVNVVPGLVPVGLRWRLMERSPSGNMLPVTRLDRSNPLLVEIDVGSDQPLPGAFRFVAQRDGEAILLGTVEHISGVVSVPIDAHLLPPGEVEVRMEYLLDGQVVLSETQPVGVGLVQVHLEPLVANLQAGSVEGALVITADGPVHDVHVVGEVAAQARSLLSSTEVGYRQSLEDVVTLGRESIRVPFSFPLPDGINRWTVRVAPEINAPEGVRVRVEVPESMTSVTGSSAMAESVLARVKEQFLQEFLLYGAVQLPAPPRDDGSWADVDYADQSVGGWKAVPHLDRVWQMARAYAMPDGPHYHDALLRERIIQALGYWVEHKFRNPNWWFNTIWQPHLLADVMLLMGDDIPRELWDASLQIVRDEVLYNNAGPFTGANLVWLETNRLRLGLLTWDVEMVAHAFAAMSSELRVVSVGREGGIQVDGSFHQHGTMLYSGGYGEAFVADLGRLAYVARGTNLFPREALGVLVDFVLDGQQWLVRGLTFDFNAMGRVLSRQQTSGNAKYLIGLVRTLTALPDVPRRDELQAFLDRLTGAGEPLRGNRYFWTSDFMTHHRPGYYVSLKAASPRTLATEIGNYENLYGYHLGDGMMFIMQTGREYDQTFAVWNWEQLPGTTVRHMEHPLLLDGRFASVRGAGDPASGVSDGEYGAMAMYLKRDGVAARKAWFFFDAEVVALGTDIHVPAGSTVTTSVNQTLLAGDVLVGSGEQLVVFEPEQQTQLPPGSWVYHDGVAYLFLESDRVMLSNRVQEGRWSDINSAYSNQPLAIPIFSMWFDHSNSAGPESYAYIIAPGMERERAQGYVRSHGVKILSNGPSLQAVWHEKLLQLQAVLWEPGTVVTPSGWTVSVDAPVLVLVKEDAASLEVTVATLERKSGAIQVNVERADGSPTRGEARFVFPEGDFLGRSLTQVISLESI